MSTVLEFDAVSKVHGTGHVKVDALTDVSLRVVAGELVAIMGPSGCGKTTLLSLAGGLDQPSEGTVSVSGADLANLGARAVATLRRTRIGYVFQQYNLIDGLTAAENVSLPLELDGVGRRKARDGALAALASVDLVELAGRFPEELSGGEQQRVAIARAIVGERTLMLADEPTGALDSVTGESVMRLVRAQCERGGAGVVVTHDARLAAWADRVVFLRDGRIVDQTAGPDAPESLLAEQGTS